MQTNSYFQFSNSFERLTCHSFSWMLAMNEPAHFVSSPQLDAFNISTIQRLSKASRVCVLAASGNQAQVTRIRIRRKVREEHTSILSVFVLPAELSIRIHGILVSSPRISIFNVVGVANRCAYIEGKFVVKRGQGRSKFWICLMHRGAAVGSVYMQSVRLPIQASGYDEASAFSSTYLILCFVLEGRKPRPPTVDRKEKYCMWPIFSSSV